MLQCGDKEMLTRRSRRNSDTILYVRGKEDETTTVHSKLKQTEIKFHEEKIKSLEKEIEKLRAGSEEATSLAVATLTTGDGGGRDSINYLLSRIAFSYWMVTSVTEPKEEKIVKLKQNKTKNECEEYPQKDSQWLLLVGFEIY